MILFQPTHSHGIHCYHLDKTHTEPSILSVLLAHYLLSLWRDKAITVSSTSRTGEQNILVIQPGSHAVSRSTLDIISDTKTLVEILSSIVTLTFQPAD